MLTSRVQVGECIGMLSLIRARSLIYSAGCMTDIRCAASCGKELCEQRRDAVHGSKQSEEKLTICETAVQTYLVSLDRRESSFHRGHHISEQTNSLLGRYTVPYTR